MTGLILELLNKAKPFFQEYKTLSTNCPKCGAPLVLKYASNPKHLRRLSIIIACSDMCDRDIWNTNAKEGFTHWWLDGVRDKVTYEDIVNSLPLDENKMIRELERDLIKINKRFI